MKRILYKKLLAGCTLGVLSACQFGQNNEIHLRGQLQDMPGRSVVMSYDGASSFLGNSKDVVLNLDTEGRFDTILTLTAPAYYNISRNTLYLSPGDDLTIKITQRNSEAEFSGKGAEANNYMKDRLFPHAGSYLEGGMNVRDDFASTRILIDSLAQERRKQLMALQNVSDEFKRLESARISADVLNSYSYYPTYANIQAQIRKSPEMAIRRHQVDSFYLSLSADVQAMVRELNREENLNVAVVRSVISNLLLDRQLKSWSQNMSFTSRAQELVEAARHIDKLSEHLTDSVLSDATDFTKQMENQDFADELLAKIEQAGRLLKGQAFDLMLSDVEGNSCRLSDFKGKVIYLDFWATWCGPCIQESPYFESLAKEYIDKDIVFLPISIDTNKKTWNDYLKVHSKELTQYHSLDEAIKEDWAIKYIPRFVLIDKDFKIVDAYAPAPSDGKIHELLTSLLSQ